MIETINTFNISPILESLEHCLAFLGGFTILGIIVFLVYSHKNINVLVNQNNKFLDKFPLVNPNFINKNQKEMAIENNQEIQEINKKLELMEDTIRSNIKHIMELEKNG